MPAVTATVAAGLVVPFVLQGDLLGQLYEGGCADAMARSSFASLFEVGREPGGLAPVVLGSGDLFAPAPAGRHAIDHEDSYDAMAALLIGPNGAPRFDAVLPGNFELSLERGALATFTERVRFPWTIANLSPAFASERERLIRRGNLLIGVTGVLDDGLRSRLHARTRSEELTSAEEALKASVVRLRSSGAQVVVALFHSSRSGGVNSALSTFDGLEGAAPDLVLMSGVSAEVELVRFHGGRPVVVPVPRGHQRAALVRVRVGGARAEVLDATAVELELRPDPNLDRIRKSVCDELDTEVARIPDDVPVDREAFIRFVLALLRQRTGAEIAIINRGAFSDDLPIKGALTRLSLHRAIPFSDRVQVAQMQGVTLAKLVPLLSNPRAAVMGLEPTKAAGRSIDAVRTYRVVTVDFVADGGDGLVDPKLIRFERSEDMSDVREEIADFLTQHGWHLDADVDADDVIDEPALFDARVDLGGSIKTVRIDNDAGYEAPQLTRTEFIGVTALLDIRISADFTKHRLMFAERSRYGVSKENADASRENDDVTTFELTYLWRISGPGGPWYVPHASVTASLETELTVPKLDEGGTREYRRGLFAAGVGPSWPILGNLTARSQFGFRREIFADSNATAGVDPTDMAAVTRAQTEQDVATARAALLSSVELVNLAFETAAERPLTISARVDHSLDLAGAVKDNILQARVSFDVPITRRLSVTASAEVYFQDRSELEVDRGAAVAFDTLFGIRTNGDLSAAWF